MLPPPHRNIILVLAVVVCFSACQKRAKEEAGGRGGAVPVTAAEVVRKEVPVVLRAIGNVRASATVSVKPRVGGQIAAVQFLEGQEVKQGQVLVLIDPKPFEVALAQAKAALSQVRAQADNAQAQAKRYSSLGKTGVIAKEQIDQLQSTAKASVSGQDASEAAVQEAELQLGYCTIRSPLDGRAGRRLVDAGNVVTANVTDLVVVNQIQPIEVVFSVAEQFLTDVNRHMGDGKLKVLATPANRKDRTAAGELTFVDNAVKAATGTIDLKATFPNDDLALWPGQFADVALTLTTEPDAIVVPAPAVQTGQKGQYVFVIKADKTVEMRPVEMTRTLNDEAVIRKGLAAGESVVIDGHLRLFPGAKIDLKPPIGSAPARPQTAQAAEAQPSAAGKP